MLFQAAVPREVGYSSVQVDIQCPELSPSLLPTGILHSKYDLEHINESSSASASF
jgi:hypothetical protein